MADCIASQEYQHGTLFQGLWLSANLLPDLDVSPHYEKYTVNSTVHVICGLNSLPAGNCMSAQSGSGNSKTVSPQTYWPSVFSLVLAAVSLGKPHPHSRKVAEG